MPITHITYEGDATLDSRGRGNIKPHGRGKMTYVDGAYAGCRYEGEFVDGKCSGQGKWYRPDNTLQVVTMSSPRDANPGSPRERQP